MLVITVVGANHVIILVFRVGATLQLPEVAGLNVKKLLQLRPAEHCMRRHDETETAQGLEDRSKCFKAGKTVTVELKLQFLRKLQKTQCIAPSLSLAS